MNGFSSAAVDAISRLRDKAKAAAAEWLARETERQQYIALWVAVQAELVLPDPRPQTFIDLSQAIRVREPDKDRALIRLAEEYQNDLPWVMSSGGDGWAPLPNEHVAKALIVDALLEADKENPDLERITNLAKKAWNEWPADVMQWVQQDLQSKRKVDIKQALAEKSKPAVEAAQVFSDAVQNGDYLVKLNAADTQDNLEASPDLGRELERFGLAMGETGRDVLAIANSGKSAGERAGRICELDAAYWAWKSPAWATLLRCSAANIRKSGFWKIDRPKHFADVIELYRDRNPDADELPDELKNWNSDE
jgi:hypothetical protein